MTEEPGVTEDNVPIVQSDEPDFDVDPNDEEELRTTEYVQSRNRKRVLIPLVLMLILFTVLSFLGPPADEDSQNPETTEQGKTP